MRREPGFYWVALVGLRGVSTIARWDGEGWCFAAKAYAAAYPNRVRKVLSGRLTPPSNDWIPSPPNRVLLESGKGYREELNVDRVNHATGAVYVSRKGKP